MNLPDVPLFSLLRERMVWLNSRHAVLSQNVANADVPGYVARDLKPQDFSRMLTGETQTAGFAMTVSNPQHIASPDSASGPTDELETADSSTITGANAVSPEEELIKVADTQAQYQAATNLYAKSVQMMRTAIDRTGS